MLGFACALPNLLSNVMKSKLGFSLIELVVTLSIIIIILAFTIPSQTIFLTKTNQNIASQQLLHAISLAHSEAILRGVPVSLCKSKDHTTCSGNWDDGQIIFTDDNRDGIVIDKSHVLTVLDPLKGATLHWRSALSRDYLQILSNGLSTENGSFWYCTVKADNPAWAIRISQTGRARLEYPDQTGKINGLSCH